MSAPVLNRRLVLEAPVRVADGAGGYATVWSALGEVWAEVLAGTGREATAVGTALSRIIYRITVRAAPVGAPSRPRPGQRFREGTRLFKVISVTERDQAGRYLVCQAEEETAA